MTIEELKQQRRWILWRLEPGEPDVNDQQFRPQLNFITRRIPPIRDKEQARVTRIFYGARQAWLSAKAETERRNKEQLQQFEKARVAWEETKAGWLEDRRKRNAALDESKQAYLDRHPESIPEYCQMVLSASKYPHTFSV